MFKYYFPIVPVAKGRPRFTRAGHCYTPSKTAIFEKQIQDELLKTCLEFDIIDYPISVGLIFDMPRPKKPKFKVPAVKPDLENLCKSLIDALNGIIIADDSLICDLTCIKRYSDKPGIYLHIRKLELGEQS